MAFYIAEQAHVSAGNVLDFESHETGTSIVGSESAISLAENGGTSDIAIEIDLRANAHTDLEAIDSVELIAEST